MRLESVDPDVTFTCHVLDQIGKSPLSTSSPKKANGENRHISSIVHDLFCSLQALLSNQLNAWQKIADLPLTESTCVSLHGRVLAIGGVDAANQSAKNIYVDEQATNSEIIMRNSGPQWKISET